MNRIVDTFQWLSIARTATVNLDAEQHDPESTSPPNFSSADDSIADAGRIRSVDDADDPEFDRSSEHLEEASAVAEQRRDLIDLELVERRGFDLGSGDLPAGHHVPVANSGLCLGRGR
jgi:hypothetical protein